MSLCLGCMDEKGDSYICPYCGYVEGTPPKESYHIKPGEILHGKYIIGKVLGYGGFGITYIALDYTLGRKVAIKEFLPSDFATRMPGEKCVTVYNGEATHQFGAGLERFVEEAQRLAKFNSMGSIVDIYDTFIENSTGYIVMQYLAGDTVKELIERNGVMPYESARLIIVEVLKTLEAVHKEGIIHRDISPDNIFITNDNQIKLLDFGAARYASGFHSKSLSVILKPGYAPEEQYRSHGNQGPWSDVYATAATLYKMITGITIEEAMERTVSDKVKSPLELGVDLPNGANTAIMNALNIHAELRTQSAGDFIRELASDEVERVIDKPVKTDSGKMPLWLKIAIPTVIVIVITLVTLVATGVIKISGVGGMDREVDFEDRVPDVLNKMMNVGEEILADKGLGMQIVAQDYDEFAEKDIIKTQSPDKGREIVNCYYDAESNRYLVYVMVSGGPAPKMVPDVSGMSAEEATATLQALGFLVETAEEYSQDIAAGMVISQDIVNQEYAHGSTLYLVVSKGEMKVDESKMHKIPDLVGSDYEQAYKKLTSLGMYVVKKEETSTKPENQVLSQSVAKDTECPEGTIIELTVSNNSIVIPDVQYKEKNEAKKILEAAGAKVVIKEVEIANVAAGLVISQSKSGKATAGTTVTLQVSKGEANKTVQDAMADIQKQNIDNETKNTAKDAKTVSVPNVLNQTLSKAKASLQSAGLQVKISYVDVSNKAQDGKVVDIYPASGTAVAQGSSVMISIGQYAASTTVVVPNVVGKSSSQAVAQLKQADLKVSAYYTEVTDKKQDDKILDIWPSVGQSVEAGSTVDVTIGKYSEPVEKVVEIVVPDVVGKTEADAKKTIQNAGLTVTVSYKDVDDKTKNGKVLSASPSVGTSVKEGSKVTITVGTYSEPVPEMVTVPDVMGKTEANAKSTLQNSGLKATVKYQDVTDQAKDGKVVSMSYASGKSVEKGTTVTITVGRYVAPKKTVPNVTGRSVADAKSLLEGNGLKVNVVERSVTEESQNGMVLSSAPSSGSSVEAGTTVNITVGKLQKVTIPDVTGGSYTKAEQLLNSAGLEAEKATENVTDEELHGKVIATSPAEGKKVAYGTKVTVTVGNYKNTPKVPVPDVEGMPLDEATQILLEAGFSVKGKSHSDEYVRNPVVQYTNPFPGDSVPQGSTITVYTGE